MKLLDLQNTRPNSEGRREVVLAILELFERSPGSLFQLYDLNASSYSPLHWFMLQGEDISSIKALCRICPRTSQARLFKIKDSIFNRIDLTNSVGKIK